MKTFKKCIAWIISLAMAVSFIPSGLAVLSEVNWTWGSITGASKQTVAPGTVYHAINADTSAGPQKIHAIEFNPKSETVQLRAGKSHGNVYGVQTVLGITNEMEKDFPGQVVAGINGDFFDLGVGVPFGVFIDDGRILSTPPQYSSSFGIKNDGTPFVLTHGTIMNKILVIDDKKIEMSGLNNRIKDADSLMMYTEDYGASTRTKADSLEIVCRITSGEPRSGETMMLTVEKINDGIGNTQIEEGTVVLSATGARKEEVAVLQEGYEISAYFQFTEFWQDVKFAVGGNYTILQNGEVQDVSDNARNPRTVIGYKEDGTVVFYTIDGRQKGYSAGASLKQAATIMRDMGCVAALNLDGGGSTTFVLRPAGSMTRKVMNSPSEGSLRQVANALVLINTAEKYDAPTALFIQPASQKMLVGGAYDYVVSGAMDPNIQPHEVRGPFAWSVDSEAAEIDAGGKLYANEAGTIQISVMNETAAGVTSAEIVDTLTEIRSSFMNAKLKPDAKTGMTVNAIYNGVSVAHSNDQLVWSADEQLGEIVEPGVIRTGEKYAEGNIYVSYKDVSLTIPVIVDGKRVIEFSDLDGYVWAQEAVYRLAEKEIIRGVSESEFAPAKPIKRADFMLLLVRMMGIDTTEKPEENFEDVPESAYYYNELGAAKKLGIANGVSETEFAPERNITRQEMFTLIWRVMKQMKYLNEDAALSALDAYADAADVSEYARQAIATMSSLALVQGDSAGCVNPKNPATRAEAAVFIDRVNMMINPPAPEQEAATEQNQEEPSQDVEQGEDVSAPIEE